MPEDFLQIEFLGNQVLDYLLAIAILLAGTLLTNLVRGIVIQRLKWWSRHTASDFDDRLIRLLEQPTVFLLYLGTLYISLNNLELHPILSKILEVLVVIGTTFLVVRLVGSLIEYVVRVYWLSKRDEPNIEQTLSAIIPASKVIVWSIGVIFLLDNLGFDISAVIASLGIGGVAVALASQGVLQDLFSYFAILFDRPFEIGDFIIVGDLIGTVEHVGIKTTHIRSLSGEQLIVANTDLTGSRIQNFKRMQRRRVVFSVGVTYQTGFNQIKKIPQLIQSIIESTQQVSFDRAHFFEYGDFSLNFEVVYYVETNDYTAYMDAQQKINLEIKAAFDTHGIEFAYPTQLLYLNNTSKATYSNGNGTADHDGAKQRQEAAV